MYRAVCLFALRNGIIKDGVINNSLLIDNLEEINVF